MRKRIDFGTPDWARVRDALSGMTMRQLRPIKSRYFNGCLGGASTKREVVDTMVNQLQHWWRCGSQGPVTEILDAITKAAG